MKNVLEMSVLAELEKAAPRVIPGHESYRAVVKALDTWAGSHVSLVDGLGVTYWRASLAEILILTSLSELSPKSAGSICRNFCLPMKRENNGYHVAWSEKQLTILKRSFDLVTA